MNYSLVRAAAVAAALILVFLQATAAVAQDADDLMHGAGGSARLSYWSGSRSLDDEKDIARGELWLNGKVGSDRFGVVRAEGWLALQSEYADRHDRSSTFGEKRVGRIRELYWERTFGALELKVGRQLMLWGRADAINPTDALTPQDFTLLTSSDTDQRFGNFAVTVTHRTDEYSTSFIWMPEFQSDVVPLPREPLVRYHDRSSATRQQFAAKLDRSSGAIDWSVSYFDGYAHRPGLALEEITPQQILIAVDNHPLRAAGLDASISAGSYVFRTEAAWRRIGGSSSDYLADYSTVECVVGGDRSFGDQLNVNLQYFVRTAMDFDDPRDVVNPLLGEIARLEAALVGQTRRTQHGVTLRTAYNWNNGNWETEFSAVLDAATNESVLRGKLVHALTDTLRMELGAEYFSGPNDTTFGLLEDNSTAHLELRYSF